MEFESLSSMHSALEVGVQTYYRVINAFYMLTTSLFRILEHMCCVALNFFVPVKSSWCLTLSTSISLLFYFNAITSIFNCLYLLED